MSESIRIKKLFSDLYNGTPWTEIKLVPIVQDLTAEQAAQKPIPNANSIWQLVQHCIGWRENVLRKLNGAHFLSPEDNYLNAPDNVSPQAWDALLKRLEKSELDWEQYLTNLDSSLLDEPYLPSKGKFTVYEVIHGILHHDNYHFGQIVMLKKLVV